MTFYIQFEKILNQQLQEISEKFETEKKPLNEMIFQLKSGRIYIFLKEDFYLFKDLNQQKQQYEDKIKVNITD